MATRLEELLEKQRKLETEIASLKTADMIGKFMPDIAAAVQNVITTNKLSVSALNGKFFSLTVAEDKLTVALAEKCKSSSGKASSTSNTSGKSSDYEYFLADGRGAFADIQSAMDALGVDKASRPTHNRYDRLSKEWREKIVRKEKTAPATTADNTAAA